MHVGWGVVGSDLRMYRTKGKERSQVEFGFLLHYTRVVQLKKKPDKIILDEQARKKEDLASTMSKERWVRLDLSIRFILWAIQSSFELNKIIIIKKVNINIFIFKIIF